MDKTTDYKTKVAYATSVNLQPNQAFTPCVNVERLAWSACSLSSCARLQPHLSATGRNRLKTSGCASSLVTHTLSGEQLLPGQPDE